MMHHLILALALTVPDGASSVQDVAWETGDPGLVSAGALAFAPDGVLFVGDHQGAALFAFRTRDEARVEAAALETGEFVERLAFLLGTEAAEVTVHDLAVHPRSGAAYVSLTRGGGEAARAAIVRVAGPEDFELVDLDALPWTRASLENAPEPDDGGRRSRRAQTITDLAHHDGVLYVAGLSNEEFASKLRALPFPFEGVGRGTSVEIYHAAHGAWETRSPVRTMVPIDLDGVPHLLAGYTCTPLVRIPIPALGEPEKLVGTTVAELGNRNTPLDMIVYEKDGASWLLVANTSRGVMKVSTAGIAGMEGLSEPVARGGVAGAEYTTIEALAGVTQLARLDASRALVVVETEDGATLRLVDLP